VVVSLLVLLLVAVPMGVVSHGRDDHRESLRLVAAPVPSAYTRLRTGPVRLVKPQGTRTFAGRRYEYATWTSPWTTAPRSFTQLVPSWSATTPAGTWVQVLVQARDGAGATSSAKDLGRWTLGDATLKRSSAGNQADGVAKVSTDTLVAVRKPLVAYRVAVRLMRTPGGASPVLHSVGVSTSTPSATLPATSTPLKRTAVSLAVPAYSQMTHRGEAPQFGGGGEAWCSPTSLSMVLGYYRRLPAPATYTWVPRRWPDRWVPHVARLTYDHAYEGTGNWPFNTAYAATRTGDAFVTRLANLRMAERFVRAGIPLVLSVKFGRGQLPGAPISSTPGHMHVLTGFTAQGDPVVHDPAAASNRTVRRTYPRAAFERAWLRSWGTTYVVRDAAHPLPARPKGVRNW
jgi:hypothetical protein